jgi:hypothetical protein
METDKNDAFSRDNTYDTWKEHSFDFYKQHEALVKSGKELPNSVVLKCFCEYEAKVKKTEPDEVYTQDGESLKIC